MSNLSTDEQKDLLDLVATKQRRRGFFVRGRQVEIPMILLPYQQRWHLDMSDVRILEKSRRVGGTWGCLAAESVLEAAEQDGMSQYYVGHTKEMAAEFIGDCAFFARAYQLAASQISVSLETVVIENERRDILKYRIVMASGHEIMALSSNPASFRGYQGHARIDEAAHHKDLQAVVDAALAFLMWGGRVDICSTHFGESNDFNQIIQEVKRGKLDYSIHKTSFDEALAEGFYQRICLVRGFDWSPDKEKEFRDKMYRKYGLAADQELGCIPSAGSGAYFTRTLYEQCQDEKLVVVSWCKPAEWVTDEKRIAEAEIWCRDVLKPVLDNLDMGERTTVGQDFGRSGDLSVIDVNQPDGLHRWKTQFSVELRNIPFDVQQVILFFILDNVPHFHHGKLDARGNGQAHAEAALQRYGPQRIECVMLTLQWYSKYFPKYKAAFEDRSIKVPKSEDRIADHRRIVLDKGIPKMSDGRDKGSDGLFRHGDSAVAGLLAYAASLEETTPAAGATADAEPEAMLPTGMQGRQRATMFR